MTKVSGYFDDKNDAEAAMSLAGYQVYTLPGGNTVADRMVHGQRERFWLSEHNYITIGPNAGKWYWHGTAVPEPHPVGPIHDALHEWFKAHEDDVYMDADMVDSLAAYVIGRMRS